MTKEFKYQEPFPIERDNTEYELLTKDFVLIRKMGSQDILEVKPEGLTLLANTAMRNCAFYLREEHQRQVAKILSDKEASENDKFVALTMLQNADISAKGILPFCQDAGHKFRRRFFGVIITLHYTICLY